MFELSIIDPVTYATTNYRLFRTVTNVQTTKAYKEIGGFSFSVLSELVDFETAITTANGQGQVMIHANGQPYLHGVINSYSPNSNGFVDVECTEILQLLKDDVILGELKLSNYVGEYSPPSVGTTLDYDSYESRATYFSMTGPSYFYVPPHNFNGKNAVQVLETPEGLKSQPNTDLGWKQDIYPKWILNNPQSYNLTLTSAGCLRYFGFVGVKKESTATDTDLNAPDGVLFDTISPTLGNVTIRVLTKTGTTANTVASLDLPAYIPGTTTLVYTAMFYGNVSYRFQYSETATDYVVSVTLTLTGEDKDTGAAYRQDYGFNSVLIPKSAYTGSKSGSAFFSIYKQSIVRSLVFDRIPKQTYATWLETVEGPINFVIQDAALGTGWTWKLTYTDSDRWTVVNRLLELMETTTLVYAGIVGGRPTYHIYNYESLPTLYRFADSAEAFNVSYEKDYSDTFNVLTATAESETELNGKTVKNVYTVSIAPNPQRPNRLGRLKKRVMKPSGITDIDTLSQWALAVYEEHSYPEEPIDFDAPLTDFWIDVKLGQYITMHGLLQGKTVTEQINKISINASTGIVSVELAKRITLKSALIEARLNQE